MDELPLLRRFIHPKLAQRLLSQQLDARPGGARREMSVLFFSQTGAGHDSPWDWRDDYLSTLSSHLTTATETVLAHEGFVLQFIGDTVLACWGAPEDDPQHRLHACLAAVECRRMARSLNEGIKVRAGIASGEMFAGLFGSEHRLQYAAAGRSVAIASRLEAANRFFGTEILAHGDTLGGTSGRVESRPLGRVRFPGSADALEVHEVLGAPGSLSPDQRAGYAAFKQGIDRFLAGKFGEAKHAFTETLRLLPDDRPALLFANTCEDYEVIAPAGDWRVFNIPAR